jgi:membrane-bound inhibitor of C-type lysozyme
LRYRDREEETLVARRRIPVATLLVALLPLACRAEREYVFRCEGPAELRAVFYRDSVRLTFPDHRTVSLPQTISASGARYSDGTLTFWNKGVEAVVQQGESTLYSACRAE